MATASVSLGLSASESRSAAVSGRGTGFGVQENVWARELTEDGRVYYYNRATGSSQWHLPDDLYESTRTKAAASKIATVGGSVTAEGCKIVYPTHAKATLKGVDCVTEVPPPRVPTPTLEEQEAAAAASMSTLERLQVIKEEAQDMSKAWHVLPKTLADMLRSQNFVSHCISIFQDEGATDLAIAGTFDLVEMLAATLDISPLPPMKISKEGIASAAVAWNVFVDHVQISEFPNFVQFSLAFTYLNQRLAEERS